MAKLRFKPVPTTRAAKGALASDEPQLATPTKLATIISLLERPQGAGMGELIAATGWQAHSVRGAVSGTLKKHRKLPVISEKADGVRVYRIVGEAG